MSCSCFSSSELFILAGGAGDKRQGGRDEGDTGEGEQKARCRWRGVRLHYPEVGIAPAPPPPPGAPHAVRSSHAPTLGPRPPHLRRAGLGAEPGRGVGRWRRVRCRVPGAPAILPVVSGPTKAAAAPGFPPRRRAPRRLTPGSRGSTPELDSGSEQERSDPRASGSCPSSHALLSGARAGKPTVLHQAPAHQASACCGLSS